MRQLRRWRCLRWRRYNAVLRFEARTLTSDGDAVAERIKWVNGWHNFLPTSDELPEA